MVLDQEFVSLPRGVVDSVVKARDHRCAVALLVECPIEPDVTPLDDRRSEAVRAQGRGRGVDARDRQRVVEQRGEMPLHRASQLAARQSDLLLLDVHVLHQRREVHLAIAAHAGQLGGALDLRADAFQHEFLLDEGEPFVLAQVRDVAVVDRAVPEREHGVLAAGRVIHASGVCQDRALDLQIGGVEDPHTVHHVRGTIDAVRENPVLSQTGWIDDSFLL